MVVWQRATQAHGEILMARDEQVNSADTKVCKCGARIAMVRSYNTGREYAVNVRNFAEGFASIVNRGDFHNCPPAPVAEQPAAAPALIVNAESALADVKAALATDSTLAEYSILTLYSYQTDGEQSTGAALYQNGAGFNGVDAGILSSFAEQIARKVARGVALGACLSEKQLALALKRLPRYAKQIKASLA